MGNSFGCGGDKPPQNIDEYVKSTYILFNNNVLNLFIEYHLSKMKLEENNYELAKQDRSEQERNFVVGKSDLAFLIRTERLR
jgi:hypothetical protein